VVAASLTPGGIKLWILNFFPLFGKFCLQKLQHNLGESIASMIG
jgi:hypothetical protein